jgi:hypothetical protein
MAGSKHQIQFWECASAAASSSSLGVLLRQTKEKQNKYRRELGDDANYHHQMCTYL